MRYRIMLKTMVFLLCILFFSSTVQAQDADKERADTENRMKECVNPSNISTWLNCRVDEISAAKLQQRDPGKQVQVPSIADNTTTLVDRSESPDVLGVALNLAGLTAGTEGEEKKTSMSFTTTAYALYAAAKQVDPLNPAFYVRHPNLRRFSFTFGQEIPEGEDNVDGKQATLFGTKILIINGRDASLPRNRARLRSVSQKLGEATRDFSLIADEVTTYLYEQLWQTLNLRDPSLLSAAEKAKDEDQFIKDNLGTGRMAATLNLLTEEQLADINNIITNRIESRVVLDETDLRVIEEIRRAPQLAFTFQSKLREGDGDDEYRSGLTFDYGLYRRINLTLNASFDYLDSKTIGGDKRGGRVAAETYFQLTRDRRVLEGAGPWLFSIAGEGKWLSDARPAYVGQLKLTIPVIEGIDFPISVSFANRSDLIKESHIRGRFGFSFDIARLLNRSR